MSYSPSHILVLDIGSSSTRAMLFDERAALVPGAVFRRTFDFHVDVDGRCEDDPIAAFERICAVLDEAHAFVMRHASCAIAAIGISAYSSSLLCLGEDGAPLTPVYTYADTRSAAEARRLRQQVDEMAALQRTGCRIRANYLPSKIAWIARTQPESFRRARWFATLSDYIRLRLYGQVQGGISAWSWSGLLNRRSGDWDREWLQQLGISLHQLPPLAPDGAGLTGLLLAFAARWPAFRAVPCLPAVGDGAAANAGSGCVDDAHIAVTIGSTAALRIVGQAVSLPSELRAESNGQANSLPYIPPALWCYRVDHARELIGGATTEGGNVFAWARRALQLPDAQALEVELSRMPPDAHGMTVLPLFAGERSPGYSEDSRATLHGLSLDTAPADIARACLEAIAYRLALIYDELRTVAQPGAQLIASGGALLASPTWCQILADVTGAYVRVCEEPEATSRGIALLALLHSGAINRLDELPARHGVTYEPDPQRQAIYRAAILRQQELYRRVM
jgi:gluconokinase